MPRYRRVWVPGGTYFFTVNLLERRRRLLVERIDALRAAFVDARGAHSLHVNGFAHHIYRDKSPISGQYVL